jgi:predicted methyltransferase
MRRLTVLLAAALGLAAPPLSAIEAPAQSENCEACEAALELALAHPRRADDRARDSQRHPAETLAFFRVRPGMTVVDYMPSGGWYTRILVPYLGPDGRYIGLNPDVSGANDQMKQYLGGLGLSFPSKAAQWTGAAVPSISAFNSNELTAAQMGTADRVMIFREIHNLRRWGWIENELGTIHGLLKPDGLLGIVQHRAKADAPDSYVDGSKGYLREADVIRLVEASGFELAAKSEINANPRDTADHPAGVWELPPVLRTKREELRAVGESDRMTLLFRKRP